MGQDLTIEQQTLLADLIPKRNKVITEILAISNIKKMLIRRILFLEKNR